MRSSLLLAYSLPTAFGHSYLTSPKGRYGGSCFLASPTFHSQPSGEWGTCAGPCDRKKDRPTTKRVVKRGETLDFRWARNNHNGGFVRFAWAPLSESDNFDAFHNGVQKYACQENGPGNNGRLCQSDSGGNGDDSLGTSSTNCGTTLTVPLHLTDGDWTVQWAYYGCLYSISDYYSCVDYTISGGPTGPKAAAFFQGGDRLYPGQDKCQFGNTDRIGRLPWEPPSSPYNDEAKKTGTSYSNNAQQNGKPVHPPGGLVSVTPRAFALGSAAIGGNENAPAAPPTAAGSPPTPTAGAGCIRYATDGWHAGVTITASASPYGKTWEDCAIWCGQTSGCTFWTLQTTGDQKCILQSFKGQYYDTGGHIEGPACAGGGGGTVTSPPTKQPTPAPVDKCANVNCGANGNCASATGLCVCNAGFTGNFCQTSTAGTCVKYATTGYHDGTAIETLLASQAPDGGKWTWEQCASRCAANAACEFWGLQLVSPGTCYIKTGKGTYHDVGNHAEGDRMTGCAIQAPTPTKQPTPPPVANPTNAPATITYSTVNGPWSVCSVACGGGKQTRTVTCKDSTGQTVNINLCPHADPTEQDCNGQPCAGYQWLYSSWTACSKGCGGGTRQRKAYCVSTAGGGFVANALCTDQPEAFSEACNTQVCTAPYFVAALTFTECSVPCGGGTMQRSTPSECYNADGSPQADIQICKEQAMYEPPMWESCNEQPCAFDPSSGAGVWDVCPWDECTAECQGTGAPGSMVGVMYREVKCVDQTTGAPLDPSLCLDSKPVTQMEGCNPWQCTGPNWMTSPWGACIAGVRSRDVHCHLADGRNGAFSDCSPASMPVTKQACALNTCPTRLSPTPATTFIDTNKVSASSAVAPVASAILFAYIAF